MKESKIIVNSIEKLINKAQEFAASHGGTKIGSSKTNSGEYV